MKISTHQSSIRTLSQSDPNFIIYDKFVSAPRAGFEISQHCPKDYRMIIQECIRYGWLKPIANITERELLFIGLTKK